MSFSLFKKKKRIYLDYASITPIAREVKEAMEKGYELFYNPSSIHRDGVAAKKELDRARQAIADFFHAHSDEIIFTGSGTESCAMALMGVVMHAKKQIARPHIIISAIEHAAVSETAKRLEEWGVEVSVLPVDEYGGPQIRMLKEMVKEQTVLVSVMAVNNEIGAIAPIREISLLIQKIRKETHSSYPLFHTDASQTLLYEDLDMRRIHADLLSGDGIKCYGPRGIGVLYKRRGVELEPLIPGGGQESGLRSGTENLPAIVGFAEALALGASQREEERNKLSTLRAYAQEKILAAIPSAYVHGKEENTSPHILNICFPESDAEYVVISLDALGISCSYASACRSLHGDGESRVVGALGKKDCARSSVRFSFGRDSTKKDINILAVHLTDLFHRGVIKSAIKNS